MNEDFIFEGLIQYLVSFVFIKIVEVFALFGLVFIIVRSAFSRKLSNHVGGFINDCGIFIFSIIFIRVFILIILSFSLFISYQFLHPIIKSSFL